MEFPAGLRYSPGLAAASAGFALVLVHSGGMVGC